MNSSTQESLYTNTVIDLKKEKLQLTLTQYYPEKEFILIERYAYMTPIYWRSSQNPPFF